MKICTLCKECKPLLSFNRDSHTKDGHEYRCKACKSITRKASRDASPEPNRERARNWYRANRSKVLTMLKVKRAVLSEATREQREKQKAERHEKALATRKARHPEYISRYRTKNADRIKVMRKEKYNREENTKRIAEYRKKYPETAKAYTNKWRKLNPELVRAYGAKWRKLNPELVERTNVASMLRVQLKVEPPGDLIDLILAKRKLERAIKENRYGK
jgi:hypothetical protein